jgi:hypothetical protein
VQDAHGTAFQQPVLQNQSAPRSQQTLSRVVDSTYVTVDGYIDEPGKWRFPFWSEEASQFKARELLASDALLLGRRRYEGFSAALRGVGLD